MPLPKWSWKTDDAFPAEYPDARRPTMAVSDRGTLATVQRNALPTPHSPDQRWGWSLDGLALAEAERSGLGDGALRSGRAEFPDREEAMASCEVALSVAERAIDEHGARREPVPSTTALRIAASLMCIGEAGAYGAPFDWEQLQTETAHRVFALAMALDRERIRRGWTQDARGHEAVDIDGKRNNSYPERAKESPNA